MKKLISLIVTLTLLLSCLAFSAQAEDAVSLAGTYMLDAADLGMPIQIYLFVDESGNFTWKNKLVDGTEKGSGMIGEKDGLYVMMYSDSTPEAVKSATFTLDGQSLVFSTRIPYGSAGLNPNTEDENNIIYPVANKLVYEEYLGTYYGTYVSESMMGTVNYDIEITLMLGAHFTFTSSFSAMGEDIVYAVNGNFVIDDNGAITLTAEDFEATGAFVENYLVLSSRLSSQSPSLKEYTLDLASTADVAGVYCAAKSMEMMGLNIQANFEFAKNGTYTYTAVCDGEEPYTETGSFYTENNSFLLCSDVQDSEPVAFPFENMILTAKMRIHNDVPMSTEMLFYAPAVNGVFTAEGTDEANGGWVYISTLTLNPDGTYNIAVTCEGVECYTEEGTFTTASSMAGTSLVLTDASGFETTGIVSQENINITHAVNGALDTLGFKYTK